ncbi:hypothetical protein MMYC01_202271 [Madurella mycetomatis]|uniref:Uncharacterized protein n=1 Tax=Madurella mycetomatis TaxID=100816 RepID=A0A175W8K5_9PEZI|nr:hypothetical protein MMYC01_209275 [Madurella mycetomatis]KXX79915.1 hypothetical protein MMYC01_202271 [Madurella mycetomatis]
MTTDLPAPPTSAPLSPAEPIIFSSSFTNPSERDYPCRRPSMSSTTSSAATSSTDLQLDDSSKTPQTIQRAATAITATPIITTTAAAGGGTAQDESQPAPPRRSATEVVALDAMSRNFPKPAHEPSLEELLARPPGKRSLGHYVKNAREVAPPPVDPAQRARKFEDAKRELLRAKEEIERRALKG